MKHLLRLFTFTLLISFLYQCHKENSNDAILNKETNISVNIQSAMVWYESRINASNFDGATKIGNKKPKWNESHEYGNFIEVPYSENEFLPLPKIIINGKPFANNNFGVQRIIMQKIGHDWSELGTLSYLPIDGYSTKIDQINYRNLDKYKFSGMITFKDLTDSVLIIDSVNLGQILQHSRAQKKNNYGLRSVIVSCTEISQCTDWYQSVNGSPYVYTNTSCTSYTKCNSTYIPDGTPIGSPIGGSGGAAASGPIAINRTLDLAYLNSSPLTGDNFGDVTAPKTTNSKSKISNSIPSPNTTGSVRVTFGNTLDGVNSDNAIDDCLKMALSFALNYANSSLSSSTTCYCDGIWHIQIAATTNGVHGQYSNHYSGKAIDISAINGKKMADMTDLFLIQTLQRGFDRFNDIRENFGPYFKHKLGADWNVSGHQDHIHVSVNGNCWQ